MLLKFVLALTNTSEPAIAALKQLCDALDDMSAQKRYVFIVTLAPRTSSRSQMSEFLDDGEPLDAKAGPELTIDGVDFWIDTSSRIWTSPRLLSSRFYLLQGDMRTTKLS